MDTVEILASPARALYILEQVICAGHYTPHPGDRPEVELLLRLDMVQRDPSGRLLPRVTCLSSPVPGPY